MRGAIITRDEMLAIPGHEISDLSLIPPEPLVSVIVVTYNHEAFIEQTIQGILEQQCDFPVELIIGDDKSKDRTLAICLEYQQKYPQLIRIVTRHENVGANANFLSLLGRVRGKYVALCDGDDYWIDQAKIAKQVAIMEGSPKTTLCGARVRILDNSKADSHGEVFGPEQIKSRYGLEDVIQNYLFQTSTYLFRSAALEVLQQARSIFYFDYFLQSLCAIKGELVCLPDVVSVYRHHAKGLYVGSSRLLHCERIIAVYQTLLPLVDEYHERLLERRTRVVRSFLCHELIDSGRLSEARRTARDLAWRLARHDPLRAIMMLGHVLAPGLYQKVRRLRKREFANWAIRAIGINH